SGRGSCSGRSRRPGGCGSPVPSRRRVGPPPTLAGPAAARVGVRSLQPARDEVLRLRGRVAVHAAYLRVPVAVFLRQPGRVASGAWGFAELAKRPAGVLVEGAVGDLLERPAPNKIVAVVGGNPR